MKWDREKFLNSIGFLLLAACFAYSLVKIAQRRSAEQDKSVTTIRFAHWQLEAGTKAALDAVAAEYIKKHPKVKIDQILIPERVFATWLTTRLVGGNPPDLVALGFGITDDRMARYFTPLSEEVVKPNPHNAGTALEDVPWRDTFIDGLASAPGLFNLFEYYGIPCSMVTTRLYYNAPLFEKVTGSKVPPATYEELTEVFEAVRVYNEKGGNLVAIAGSKYNSPVLMNALFAAQTQKLNLELDRRRVMRFAGAPYPAFFDGSFDLFSPAIRSALELSREIGKNMPQGFLSLAREDATFSFVQQRSLMIATGSWDVQSLRQESSFEVAAIRFPLPSRQNPQYGAYTLGPGSEAETGGAVNFGLTRDAPNPEAALDFLKYLTSIEGNRIFSEKSNWLPSIVSVPVPEAIAPFAPVSEGYPSGFILEWTGGPEVKRIYENAFHRLVRPDGGVDQFLEYFEPRYAQAMVLDMELTIKNGLRTLSMQDTTWIALRALEQGGDPRSGAKAASLQEVQAIGENSYYSRRYDLDEFEKKRKTAK